MLYYLCTKSGKISTNRWAYALLPMHEIGQNQHEKGGGLVLRHGRIIRILRYIHVHVL